MLWNIKYKNRFGKNLSNDLLPELLNGFKTDKWCWDDASTIELFASHYPMSGINEDKYSWLLSTSFIHVWYVENSSKHTSSCITNTVFRPLMWKKCAVIDRNNNDCSIQIGVEMFSNFQKSDRALQTVFFMHHSTNPVNHWYDLFVFSHRFLCIIKSHVQMAL